MLSPLFSTFEVSGVTLTWYIVEILNKLLDLSVFQFPHQENGVIVMVLLIL